MILFKEQHMKPIQKGEKTQTRRLWKAPRAKVGSVHLAKTQMLSTQYFAKLKILDVRLERLGDITPEDARKEGGYTVDEFKSIWWQINKSWDPELMVYVVEFESIPDLDLQPGDLVKMSPDCLEYQIYGDKIWTCRSPSFRTGYTEGVFLEDFTGYFATKFLELVGAK